MRAYLLAAGRGLRAGGPKAWRVFEGTTLLERQIAFLTKRLPPSEIAVSIQPGWEARCLAIAPDVRWMPVDPDASPLASFQALLKVLPDADWGSLHHVDMPVWESELFDALEAAARAASDSEAVIPMFEGRRGHPLLLSARGATAVSSLDPQTDRLDHWLRLRRTIAIDAPFACAVENWNLASHHASNRNE